MPAIYAHRAFGEDLKKRLDMVEQELREYKENEEASAKEGNYTSNQETK